MKTYMIIDGNNIAYRSFHTPQGELCTTDGRPCGVIYGVLNSLKTNLQNFDNIHKCIVAWDGGRAEWRKELLPGYKSNRSYGDTPEEKQKYLDLYAQIDSLHQNLHKFGVHSIKMSGQEADDIIALCTKVIEEDEDNNVIIVTTDKDMLQLVSDRVSVFRPSHDERKRKVVGVSNFQDETGVPIDSYIGYRALVGDSSDCIFGIKGIGEKTAANLINKYGSLDNVLGSTGKDKDALLKSKRTKVIFEPENLKLLGINNRMMNFRYIPHDEELMSDIRKVCLETVLESSSKEMKEYFMEYQFVSFLSSSLQWSVLFSSLEE